jgi:sigma-E factor negative regulatory protein RseC
MGGIVKHDGVIERITEGMVCVRIVQTSACAACKVAKYCNASESKEKLVDVRMSDTSRWSVGDRVVVAASQQMANQALVYAFGIPLVLLLLVLVVVLQLTGREDWAGLCGILSLIPYYAILYLRRSSLQKRMAFWIEE